MLQQSLRMPCVPQCTICHLNNLGGLGTLVPGGMGSNWHNMYGLDGNDVNSLAPAIMAAASEMLDTDHDGIPDVNELQMGTDPNDPTLNKPLACLSATSGPVTPIYGCVRVAPQAPIDGVATTASAAVVLIGMASLRRRAARKRRGAK